MMTDVATVIVAEMTDNEKLKAEENQLLKYNNIYDKLRKKKDLLESLCIQRKFLAHVKQLKERTDLPMEMVLEYIAMDKLEKYDV